MRPYFVLFMLASLLLAGCGPRLYCPDSVNAPMFNKPHEIKTAGSIKFQNSKSSGGGAVSPAADIAYAPIDHFGIIASYRALINKVAYLYPADGTRGYDSSTNTSALVNGNHFDIGAGYFTRIRRTGLFEAYAGYGNGSLKADSDPKGSLNQHFFDTRYHRFFVFADAGFRDDVIAVVGGIQAVGHNYYSFKEGAAFQLYKGHNPHAFVNLTGQYFWFIQPFVNVEVGYKHIFFNAQLGLSSQLNATKDNDISGNSFMYVSTGITFRFRPHTGSH